MIYNQVAYLTHRLVDLPVLVQWGALPKGSSVLEIGCRTGKTSHFLCRQLRCKTYIATDPDSLQIAKAEQEASGSSRIIFQVAKPTDLPFEKETFDAVIILDTLFRIANWKKVIYEVWRVLKKKGALLLKDYSIESFTVPGLGLVLQTLHDLPYDHMFDQVELITYLRKHGFMITHQNDNPWMMMMVAIRKPERGVP